MESRGRAGLRLEARLQGGAPWGFTLQGGLEHGEPLIISKVEDGGKADSLERPLRVGDEIVVINDVELSGFRQEAVALIKGSYKTLKLTVRREFDPGYIEEFVFPSDSSPALRLPPPPPPVPSSAPPQETLSSNHSQPCSAVQLRIRNRRAEPASRPHSWHLTKLDEGQRDFNPAEMDTISSAWHHSYPASVSTTDLSGRFDYGGGYLRKSPDQYSSRGSMESLDPPQSAQLHAAVQNPLGHHGHAGLHSAYSSCHQLSSARSSNSIDHLHSKRDSAYSTSSSIPEYLASTPSFSPERSYSLETVAQRGGGSAEMLQADVRNVRAGLSQERELSPAPAALLSSGDFMGGARSGPNRDLQVGGVCYRGNSSSSASGSNRSSVPASNRHSVGPIWGSAASCNSYESLKGAPAPPRRSDSYAAIRNHDRPNSWSSLEHARSLRSLQKGSWHHSSGPVAPAKVPYGPEGQLHTVIEKSPESSPTTKPRQGGGLSQPPSPTGPSSGPAGPLNGRDERPSAAENGNQSSSSPLSHLSYLAPVSSQTRTRTHEADSRHQQQEFSAGAHKPHVKPTGGEFDGQIGAQRPQNHQTYQVSHSQEQVQEFRVAPVHSGPGLRTSSSQERTDLRDKSRSRDQSSIYPEPAASSRLPQGQVRPAGSSPAHPQLQTPPNSALQPCPRHLSDSAVPQSHAWTHRDQDRDGEHPLTRLENALQEVQRSSSPSGVFSAGNHDNGEDARGPARSLSVLEKVSCFERREHGGKQRSMSTSVALNKASHLQVTDKGRSFPCGAEDLRNMLERSNKEAKGLRTASYRGGSSEFMKHGPPVDPVSALQRSRSSFQLNGSKEGKQRTSEMMEPLQDIRDSQLNVHRSTSFRRNPSSSAAPPPPVSSSSVQQPPPLPAKSHSLEKKGPKTKPKPQGVVITSPHVPKERHVVRPDVRGQSPPPLPAVPPVGPPPPVTRICGRKRLTADQKKRSYSEPENMNEVGVLDPEISALFRRGGETSVADRRKMFELAAVRVADGVPQRTMSRSDLRQVRQDALFDYVERKRGVRREEGGQRSGTRSRSAFLQHENANHSDTFSLSSTSSLLSLQEAAPDQSFLSGESRLCSTLPVGSDLRSLQTNLFYPGRVTTPRPPAQPGPSASPGPALELRAQVFQDLDPEAALGRPVCRRNSSRDQQQAEPQLKPGLSKKLNEALLRAGSHRGSGRSASASDLLERLENQPFSPQHHRSRSSPTIDELNQSLISGDVKMFGVSFSEAERFALAADRPADIRVVSPRPSQFSETTLQSSGPSPGPSHTPVTRRERQRNGERQRANSTSTLAASVGLPSPFPPAGMQDGGAAEWRASERLSQANLDAISFPDVPQADAADRRTRHSLSDILGDAAKDESRSRAFSLGSTGRRSEEHTNPVPPSSAPPTNRKPSGSSTPPPSSLRHQSSLRISESSLSSSFDQQQLNTQEDLDEVFFQSLLPPPPPPLPPLTPPLKETSILEDFPPPPPPLELEAGQQPESSSSEVPDRKSSSRSSPPLNLPPPSATAKDDLEYQLLPRRDKTPEEQRAETLARQLVLQDPSLAPLLDTWGGKSTVDLMEEIFANSRRANETRPGQSPETDQRTETETDQTTETNLDDEDADLKTKKVELCEALRSSVAALRAEKQALAEELRRHQALGSSLEVLVQDRLKANEREKYSVFVGDLDRIVNLLLSLCSRLSRIDRSLLCLQRDELRTEGAAEEQDSLHHKRSLLLHQTEDARELKDNLDRRQRVVHAILSGHLAEAQLRDYRRFVGAKPCLLIRQRHLDDLIRQGEEQLTRLAESLPAELAEACSSLATGSAHSVRPTAVTSL